MINNPWLKLPRPNPQARLRLFCFPYAGGSASIFRAWAAALPAEIELVAVELPGRGERFKERPMMDLPALLSALKAALQSHLHLPFVFFGHSLGALLSYELARTLRRAQAPQPQQLLVSGWRAPQLPDRQPKLAQLPEPAFIEELRRFNGTPKGVLDNMELRELFLPILRADFAIAESYIYTPDIPLSCPIAAFGGLQDKTVSRDELMAWRDQTNRNFTVRMLPGDHFFLNTAQSLLLPAIAQDLKQTLSQPL